MVVDLRLHVAPVVVVARHDVERELPEQRRRVHGLKGVSKPRARVRLDAVRVEVIAQKQHRLGAQRARRRGHPARVRQLRARRRRGIRRAAPVPQAEEGQRRRRAKARRYQAQQQQQQHCGTDYKFKLGFSLQPLN